MLRDHWRTLVPTSSWGSTPSASANLPMVEERRPMHATLSPLSLLCSFHYVAIEGEQLVGEDILT